MYERNDRRGLVRTLDSHSITVGNTVSNHLSALFLRLSDSLAAAQLILWSPAGFGVLFLVEMSGPNKASAGTGYERRKKNFTAIPIVSPMAASSSSNYRIPQNSASVYGHGPRTPSPPASAYFPLLSADTNTRLRPTPDAESHFAYSTTLRRHHSEGASLASPAVFAAAVNAEATSLWARLVNTITGKSTNEYQAVEGGRNTPPITQRTESKDTASAKFAHHTVEVRLSVLIFETHF